MGHEDLISIKMLSSKYLEQEMRGVRVLSMLSRVQSQFYQLQASYHPVNDRISGQVGVVKPNKSPVGCQSIMG
jgi:hypothetical protein